MSMEKRKTIVDVAKEAQVSTGTVHRALYGKPGVSEELRAKIVKIAWEMGYQTNQVASSLKKKPLKIVVAFPAPISENRYFFGELWKGYRDFSKEMQFYNCEAIEAPYDYDGVNSFAVNIRSILRQYQGKIDGIICGGKMLEEDIVIANQLYRSGIPLVLISENVEQMEYLCSVQSDHETDGRMAAELLDAQIPEKSQILVVAGDVLLPSNRKNMFGFESMIREKGDDHPILKIYGHGAFDGVQERVLDVLSNSPDIKGMYSVSARGTLFLAKAAEALGLKGKVRIIGSDINPESVRYLKEGFIHFIVYKQPRQQVQVGLDRLLSYIVQRKGPVIKDEYLNSIIIGASNVDKYVKYMYDNR